MACLHVNTYVIIAIVPILICLGTRTDMSCDHVNCEYYYTTVRVAANGPSP